MDNKIFNVNGKTKKQLNNALLLLLTDEYDVLHLPVGYRIDTEKGLVLLWYLKDPSKGERFLPGEGEPVGLEIEPLTEVLWSWLHSPQSKGVVHEGWDRSLRDPDVSEEIGWRLYTEEWGCIHQGESLDSYTLGAFRPCWLWYGK
jgi:hypothetical protein